MWIAFETHGRILPEAQSAGNLSEKFVYTTVLTDQDKVDVEIYARAMEKQD
jgi:hypothetical protein